jgi:glycosyltransferase involved in cell wall biosynthesis
VKRIQVLRLRANQGHQRAIALGLAYASRELSFDFAIVMDSDGEDRPADVARLIAAFETNPNSLIVAHRQQRSEGLAFIAFYHAYKFMFRRLTGKPISFGNFSLIPRARIDNVIYNPGVWNNFAATMLKSRAPISFVPTIRGKRFFGASRMSFSALAIHGMSAISVFSDIVIGRIMFGLCLLTLALVLGVAGVIAGKFVADFYRIEGYFIPGYTTNVVLILMNTLVSSLFVGLLMILSLLSARSAPAALPAALLDHLTASVDEVVREEIPALVRRP